MLFYADNLACSSDNPAEFQIGDKELLTAVAEVLVERLASEVTDLVPVIDSVCEEFPELEEQWGRGIIEDLAERLLFAEVVPESQRLTELFGEFNIRYFYGCLSIHEVRVVFDPTRIAKNPASGKISRSGFIDKDEVRIYLRYAERSSMFRSLLESMAHLVTGLEDDGAFSDQLRWLAAQGAPLTAGTIEPADRDNTMTPPLALRIRSHDLLGRSGTSTEFESYDEDFLNSVASYAVELMNLCYADGWTTAEQIHADDPELADRWGWGQIEALAESLLNAEIMPLSRIYTELFAEYNARFFLNCLPAYKVRVVFDLHRVSGEPIDMLAASSGFIQFTERCIYIRYTDDFRLTGTLVHEMAHAATGGEHDEAWFDQMRWLKAHGAPVPDWELADAPDNQRSAAGGRA